MRKFKDLFILPVFDNASRFSLCHLCVE